MTGSRGVGPGPAGLLPAPTGAEAAAFDARAREEGGIPGAVLMESAGRAAAAVVQGLLGGMDAGGRTPPSVLVVAGAGKNGGDGVVLARTLHVRGVPVRLLVHPDRPAPDPLLHGHPVPSEALPAGASQGSSLDPLLDPGAPTLVVDALLGTGPTDAPREPVAGWISALRGWVEARGVPVVALDLPTGVVADTGATPGALLPAQVTLAFGAPKLGTLLHPGRGAAGRILVLEIGFPPWMPGDAGAALITPAWARAAFPPRPLDTHKNAVGRLLLVAGGATMAGAALLAARGALRTGVGMLRVVCHPDHRALLHDAVPEAILVDPGDDGALLDALAASDAVVAGPGMGLDPGELPACALLRMVEAMRNREEGEPVPALLLDADALTLLGEGALGPSLPVVADRCLLTPHPGELARILAPGEGGDARGAARRWGATCLLKGAPSVVAAPDEAPLLISASGGSAFARGGMGDVLSGVAGALLARGCRAPVAAGLALHLTGVAAHRSGKGPDSLLPSDLVAALPQVVREVAPLPHRGSLPDGDPPGDADTRHALHAPAPGGARPRPLPGDTDPSVLFVLEAPR